MSRCWLFILLSFAFSVSNAVDGDLPAVSSETQTLLDSCQRAYARDDFDDAVDFAKEAIELQPDAAICRLWLGIAYSEKTESGFFVGRLLNARKCKAAFEQAVELAPNSLDAREGLIEYHVRAPGVAGGSAETAWEHADFIMQHDSVRGYLAAAYIHERKEEDTAAAELAFLNAVAADTTNISAQLRVAGFYARHEAFDKAESVLVAAAGTGDWQALLHLAWFCINQKRYDQAYEAISRRMYHWPPDPEAFFYADLAQTFGGIQAAGESPETPVPAYQEKCADTILLSSARELAFAPSPTHAVDELKRYLESEPCYVYRPCWSYPHLMSGINSYRPGRAYARLLLARIYQRLPHKSRDAHEELERALKLDPTLWPASQELNRGN